MGRQEIKQKHYQDINDTHEKLGHLDNRKRTEFRRKEFFEEIKKLGHSTGHLEKCQCWEEQEPQR